MVEYIYIDLAFNIAVGLLLIVYVLFIFIKKEKKYNIVIRIICAFIIIVIEAFNIPIAIALGESSINAKFMIIMWLFIAIYNSIILGTKIYQKRE